MLQWWRCCCAFRGLKFEDSMASSKVLRFLFVSLFSSTIVVRAHIRHLLHQPSFAVSNSFASHPSHSYPRSTQPNIPQNTFFPSSSASPPPPSPPSPTFLATFPANISSIVIPHSQPSSALTHRNLFIWLSISLSLLFSAISAALFVCFLYSHRRREDVEAIGKKPAKPAETECLFPPNSLPSDSPPYNIHLPKLSPHSVVRTPSSSASLHPETLAGVKGSFTTSFSSRPQSIRSPDLKPLPPMPKTSYEAIYKSRNKTAFGQVDFILRGHGRDDGFSINESFSSSLPSSNNNSFSSSPSHVSGYDNKPQEEKTKYVAMEDEALSISSATSSYSSLSSPKIA